MQTFAELARRLEWIQGKELTEARKLANRLDAVLAGLLASVRRRKK